MIKFMLWIVECEFAKKVSLNFLIKGHTKNICDWHDYLVKKTYHKKNIYTKQRLDEVLGKSNYVMVHWMEPLQFKNSDKQQREVYTKPTNGIMQDHPFTFGHSDTTLTSYG